MGTLFIFGISDDAPDNGSARKMGQCAARIHPEKIDAVIQVPGRAAQDALDVFLAEQGTGKEIRLACHVTWDVIQRGLIEGLNLGQLAKPLPSWCLGSLERQQAIASGLHKLRLRSDAIVVVTNASTLPPVFSGLQRFCRDTPGNPLDPGKLTVVHLDNDAIWCEQPAAANPAA